MTSLPQYFPPCTILLTTAIIFGLEIIILFIVIMLIIIAILVSIPDPKKDSVQHSSSMFK